MHGDTGNIIHSLLEHTKYDLCTDLFNIALTSLRAEITNENIIHNFSQLAINVIDRTQINLVF